MCLALTGWLAGVFVRRSIGLSVSDFVLTIGTGILAIQAGFNTRAETGEQEAAAWAYLEQRLGVRG